MSEKPPEKRIIIDEDWKSQVQKEKEEAHRAGPKQPADQRPPLPPASFAVLLTSLATQALITLGELPNPLTQKKEMDPEHAKHLIDMLGVLEEKTKGNLTAEEKGGLEALLFDFRLKYVEATKTAEGGAQRAEGQKSAESGG